MHGVYINLTGKDISLKNKEDKEVIIPGNPELITPIKSKNVIKQQLIGVISTPLEETDVHYIAITGILTSNYNKILRTEKEVLMSVNIIHPYSKYQFTTDQIMTINNISNGRTRLLILTKDDAEFWSSGKFENPFRNYRLFILKITHL